MGTGTGRQNLCACSLIPATCWRFVHRPGIKQYPAQFGARVYKITRDEKGNRLTHVKLTGGSLKVKELIGEEKVDQLRFYSGVQFRTELEVSAGEVCAITGLEKTKVGQGLGVEASLECPISSFTFNEPPVIFT